MEEGKPFEISKQQVIEAYRRVKANHGAGGTDGIDFTEFVCLSIKKFTTVIT